MCVFMVFLVSLFLFVFCGCSWFPCVSIGSLGFIGVPNVLGFPGLVSNAISQDGDALFPLLVRHRAASLWATLHTAVPAIITGLMFYLGA